MKVEPHPDADSLYVEEIDLGEGQPRQVTILFANMICIPHAAAGSALCAWSRAGSLAESASIAVLTFCAPFHWL